MGQILTSWNRMAAWLSELLALQNGRLANHINGLGG
jgi:hypothetical protein